MIAINALVLIVETFLVEHLHDLNFVSQTHILQVYQINGKQYYITSGDMNYVQIFSVKNFQNAHSLLFSSIHDRMHKIQKYNLAWKSLFLDMKILQISTIID